MRGNSILLGIFILIILVGANFCSGVKTVQAVGITPANITTTATQSLGGQQGHQGCPLGYDYAWIDFVPGSDPHNVDGGFFESETWSVSSQVTSGDFDDTDQMNWTDDDGIYSAVRNDQDLNDGTSADGTWCSCAKETGGAWTGEWSAGWAKVEKSFNINDYVNTAQSNFEFTNVTVYYDYKILSADFNDAASSVYLIAYLNDGSNDWPLEYKWYSSPSEPNAGYSLDFWEPDWNHPLHNNNNPNYYLNDGYSYRITTQTLGGGSQYVLPIASLFNQNQGTTYTLKFKILVGLYGAPAGGSERYAFWIDNVRMKASYFFNHPPTTPAGASPANESTGVSIDQDLQWTGGDPDGDSVTYGVYFGTTNPPPYQTTVSTCSYDPGQLSYSTTYYWQIKAIDYYNYYVYGPIWHFTTGSQPQPPSNPVKPFRDDQNYTVYTGVNWELKSHATDPNGNTIRYGWDWNNDNTVDDWTDYFNSGDDVGCSHVFDQPGTYLVKVKAQDDTGRQSGWSPNRTVTVILPPNHIPVANIDQITPTKALKGERITFNGSGSDEDGTIVAYYWRSSIDGWLSNQSDFSNAGLSIGVHTIYLKVKDNRGDWSVEDTATLTVGFYFIHITDPHAIYESDDRWVNIIQNISNRMYKPEFVICSGDLVDWGEGATGYANYQTLLSSLHSTFWDHFLDPEHETPIYFCPGNHDYRMIYQGPPYSLVNYQLLISPTTEYSTNRGNCAIFSINSGHDWLTDLHWELPEGSGLFENEKEDLEYQLDMLDGTMNNRDNSHMFKIVFMHHPHYNPNGDDGTGDGAFVNFNDDFKTLCRDYGVNIVLYGHIHPSASVEFDLNGTTWDENTSTGTHCIATPAIANSYAMQAIKIMPLPTLGDSWDISVENPEYIESTLSVAFACQVNGSAFDSKNHRDGYNWTTGGYDVDIPDSSFSMTKCQNETLGLNETLTEISVDHVKENSYRFHFNSTKNDTMNMTLLVHLRNGMWSKATYSNISLVNGSWGTIYANNSIVNYTINIFGLGNTTVIAPTRYEGNLPPEKPEVAGPTHGKRNVEYNYTATPVDPDYNDHIWYQFDWGDGQSTAWKACTSGVEVREKHSWSTGDWNVKFKVKDAAGIIVESEGMTVTMILDIPSVITPYDGCYGVALSSALQWTVSEPSFIAYYEIYHGLSSQPAYLTHQTSTTYTPTSLMGGRTYYWKIVAVDIFGMETEGPVWRYTTTN